MNGFMTGVMTVTRLELTMRVRAGRWRWLLGAWVLVLTLFMTLAHVSVVATDGVVASQRGTVLYGSLQLFILGLGLLVTPTLSAQSINGERERGTLAVLQVTRLMPIQIALGKLLAAWATTAVFLLASAPHVIWAIAEGGVSFARVVVVTVVMLLLLGVICAIALGLSALLARSTTSSVLSYLSVFALTVGTVIVFGLGSAATSDGDRLRTDNTWFLLAPNPFVVLADAAPVATKPKTVCELQQEMPVCSTPNSVDPLGSLGRGVRDLRDSPGGSSGGPVWPFGLGFDLALGAFMVWMTSRRLTTPLVHVARGVRIA